MKTSELTGSALDWAVAKCEGWDTTNPNWMSRNNLVDDGSLELIELKSYSPSTDWSVGGPIIERELLDLYANGVWVAENNVRPTTISVEGPTPLVAAMRCFVASRLGDEIEIPQELTIE